MSVSVRVREYGGVAREFADFIRERKSYWLAPLIFVLLLLGSLAFFLEGSVIAPAIYSVF